MAIGPFGQGMGGHTVYICHGVAGDLASSSVTGFQAQKMSKGL